MKTYSDDEFKQYESDEEALQTILQKVIWRIRQFSLVKRRIVITVLMAVLLFFICGLCFKFYFGINQEKTEDIFANSKSDFEMKKSDTGLLAVNYEMKTFVIPMQGPAKDRVFLKADFIIMTDKVGLIQLYNNDIKIRDAIYNLFHNNNSEIILRELKRSEQLYKLKNVINLIFRSQIVKDINMVNYKIV